MNGGRVLIDHTTQFFERRSLAECKIERVHMTAGMIDHAADIDVRIDVFAELRTVERAVEGASAARRRVDARLAQELYFQALFRRKVNSVAGTPAADGKPAMRPSELGVRQLTAQEAQQAVGQMNDLRLVAEGEARRLHAELDETLKRLEEEHAARLRVQLKGTVFRLLQKGIDNIHEAAMAPLAATVADAASGENGVAASEDAADGDGWQETSPQCEAPSEGAVDAGFELQTLEDELKDKLHAAQAAAPKGSLRRGPLGRISLRHALQVSRCMHIVKELGAQELQQSASSATLGLTDSN